MRVSGKLRKREEADLQAVCSELLQLDGWRYLRTDPVSDRATSAAIIHSVQRSEAIPHNLKSLIGTIVRSCTRGKGFGEVGMADALYMRYTQVGYVRPRSGHLSDTAFVLAPPAMAEILWIEWKSLTGKPTVEQKLWIAAERTRGALVWLAGEDFPATYDGFRARYRDEGLSRNFTIGADVGKR